MPGKSAIDRTAAGAHETVNKIAGAAAPAIDRIAAGAHHAVDKFAQTAAPAAEWLETNAQKLNETGIKVVDDTKRYVRDYPFVALGAAVAVGVLISYLARSRLQ
jgi:ElaB/YqjD/DUF883 family membrane-anchored ribosome-binding protein